MRACTLILFCASLGACGVREDPALRQAPRLPAERIEVASDERQDADFNGSDMAEDLVTLGGDLRDAERDLRDVKLELADVSAPVFFLECLERRTGKDVDGAVMKRHIRRNTKDAKACKAEYADMSEAARADYVLAWVAKQDAAQLAKTR